LADALTREGWDVSLWAPDNSAANCEFLSEFSCVRLFTGKFHEVMKQVGEIDVLHDNGIWMPHNHAIADYCRANRVCRVVSTRGMLEPWARRHKRIKKMVAWFLYQKNDLKFAHGIHATAQQEADSLRSLFQHSALRVISNGVNLPKLPGVKLPLNLSSETNCAKRTALFVGRLYPVKGLPMLLEAWSSIRPPGWRLLIAGPDEAGHRGVLERICANRSLEPVVEFTGPVDGEAKWQMMQQAELFVCPSYSENFGIAIAEAMACGLPVLTTTGTPWSVLREQRIGWWVKPTVSDIGEALQQATTLSASQLKACGQKSRDYVDENYGWPDIGRKMSAFYHELLAASGAVQKSR